MGLKAFIICAAARGRSLLAINKRAREFLIVGRTAEIKTFRYRTKILFRPESVRLTG